MKKTLLFGTCIALAMTASAAQWAVVGAYTNPGWNFEASTVLSGTGNEVSATIAKLTGDFKIVDIENNNWDIQYGTATPIEPNKTYVLDGKNGGPDPANIKFAGLIQAVEYARVTFNQSTHELTITADPDDVQYGYPELYITGSFCDWDAPGEGGTVKCSFNSSNTTYTVTVNLGSSYPVDGDGIQADHFEFKLAGAGWSNEIAGPEEETYITNNGATQVSLGGSNLYTTLTGTQTLSFNYTTMMMTFGDADLVNGEGSGVSAVNVDNNETPVYYNLQGVRVVNPQNGIFIVRQGSEVKKVVL